MQYFFNNFFIDLNVVRAKANMVKKCNNASNKLGMCNVMFIHNSKLQILVLIYIKFCDLN